MNLVGRSAGRLKQFQRRAHSETPHRIKPHSCPIRVSLITFIQTSGQEGITLTRKLVFLQSLQTNCACIDGKVSGYMGTAFPPQSFNPFLLIRLM